MSRCIRAVAAASVAVGLSAIPLATASTPTKASWARAANMICAKQNARIRSLPKVSSQTYVSDLKAIAKYATQSVTALAAIPRPPAEARPIASLIAKGKTQNALVLSKAIPAAQRGDAATTNRAMAQVGKLGDQFNAIARTLGAATCAANPNPSGVSSTA